MLFKSFCNRMREMQKKGIVINRVLFENVSEGDRVFAEKTGFKSLGKTKWGSTMVVGTMEQIFSAADY